nr:MAG: hypothetical protein [Bacteriophage sp.]
MENDAIAYFFRCNCIHLQFLKERTKKRKEKFPPNPFIKKINKRKKKSLSITRAREIEIFTVKIKNST